MPLKIDRTGQRYGLLVAVKEMKSTNQGVYWLCKCDCGNTKVVSSNNLSCGQKSCGCLHHRSRHEVWASNETVESRIKGILHISYDHLKKRHKKLYRGECISFSKFESLSLQPCYFCGTKPYRILTDLKIRNTSEENRAKYKGMVQTEVTCKVNGIGRINPQEGYVDGNCVPCCEKCIFSKHGLPMNEFLAWIERIHRFQMSNEMTSLSKQKELAI